MVKSRTVETIVAEATPSGKGGVGIVRVSGPLVLEIAQALLGKVPAVRKGEYLPFLDENNETLDRGIALLFNGPNSLTGEDVLELQGHGSPIVISSLLKEILKKGARLARPGEFLERAFVNDKIDLLQAESIAELINASSNQAARCAIRSMEGEFSDIIKTLVQEVVTLRIYIEASIDFSDEDIHFLTDGRISSQLSNLITTVETIENKARQGALLSQGIKVVIIGKPNAGKSSLLNALSGYDAAIVTDIPGTTRDVLREHIVLDGLLLQLVDTAGLRNNADIVEQEGIRRALKEMANADHILLMVDGTTTNETNPFVLFPEWKDHFPKSVGITVLYNKIDKLNCSADIEKKEGYSVVRLSAKTQEGLSLFCDHLKRSVGFESFSENTLIARQRHLDAIKVAKHHLFIARSELQTSKALELVAEELRQTQLALDEITGKFTNDDLLGRIFSQFCIGK